MLNTQGTSSTDAHPLSVLYSFPHAIGDPGIGTTAWNQVASLITSGHRVTVVASSFARTVPGAERRVNSLAVGALRIPHRAIHRDNAFAWHDLVASRELRRGTFDVVHTWPLGGSRTMSTARSLGVAAMREAPNTHTAHAYDLVAREYRSLGLPVPKHSHRFNASHLRTEEREWERATAILVPSEYAASTFLAHGIGASKLLVHRYGFNPVDFAAHKPASARDPDRPFTAVFAGAGTPRKGLHYALRAWHAARDGLGNSVFRIHGKIDNAYAAHLGSLLDHPSIQLSGFTPSSAEIFAGADVLILPSIEEGSALVTYEAQAAACVPLVSAVTGARVQHNVNGLVHSPGDAAMLTQHLASVAQKPHLLARLRQAVIDRAPDLTWDAASEELVRHYRDAVHVTKAISTFSKQR